MKNSPIQNLLEYSSFELRKAANWLDRENKQYPLLNILSMIKKLEALDAHIEVGPNEKGYIEFWLESKSNYVVRDFSSANELSVSLSLGPIDIYWSDNLYVKTVNGNKKVEIVSHIKEKNQIKIKTLGTDKTRFIWLNGAEKVLSNNIEGLTAGQMKLTI